MLRSLPLIFPVQGVSENFSFSEQPVSTTRDALNVRGLDPLTGRIRGAQRPGWNKYNTAQVDATKGVLDLGVVVGDDSRITYSEFADANIVTVWNGKTTGGLDCLAGAIDLDGNIYGLDGNTGFTMWNPEGEPVQSFTLPVSSGSLRAIAVDDSRNVYVAVSTGGTQSEARLWKATANLDGTYRLGWELSLVNQGGATGAGNVCYGTKIKIVGTTMYVAVSDPTPAKAESEVHVYNGVDANATPSAVSNSFVLLPTTSTTAVTANGTTVYGMDVNSGGEVAVAMTEGTPTSLADGDLQHLVFYASTGVEVWAKDSTDTPTGGGLGLDCIFDDEGYLFSLGNVDSAATDDKHIRKFATISSGNEEWAVDNAVADFSASPFVRMAADSFGNVWAPFSRFGSAGDDYTAIGYDRDGAEIAQIPATGDGRKSHTVLVPPTIPDYADDPVTVPEFLYACLSRNVIQAVTGATSATPIVITSAAHGLEIGDHVRIDAVLGNRKANGIWVISAADTNTFTLKDSVGGGAYTPATGFETPLTALRSFRLVDASISIGSQRTQKVLAVADGNIKAANVALTAWTAPTGGTGALSATSEFICGASGFGKRVWTDGLTTVIYDLAEDEVTTLTATKGEVPARVKLLTVWRARLVHARDADSGHNWFMSAAEDFSDYDYNPVAITPTTAVAGNNSDAGLVPDIINALIPWSDDLLFFMCDNSIWRMTGDPLAGGQIDNISKTIGGAFGGSWARDPEGVLYFFSTEGGVYAMPPVGLPQRISVDWIERRLQDIDLSARHARLEWDFRNEGLCIFLVARDGTGGVQAEHYFWERKTAGWWPMQFGKEAGVTGLEPLSTLVLDGDAPGDRRVLIGCEDGYVRKQDETEKSDAGASAAIPINSHVTLGPFNYREANLTLRVVSLQVTLADNQGGANWELFASDRPDILGSVRAFGVLGPGRSPTIARARTVGEYFWLRLGNANTEHWAFENATLRVAPGGRKRVGV